MQRTILTYVTTTISCSVVDRLDTQLVYQGVFSSLRHETSSHFQDAHLFTIYTCTSSRQQELPFLIDCPRDGPLRHEQPLF